MMKYLRFWAIAIIGTVFAAPMALGDSQARKGSTEAEVIQQLDVLNSVVKELTTFYVDTLDAKKHIHTAIKAMLEDIDPYTEFISEEEQNDFLALSTGEYGGIGSYITQHKSGGVEISGPYEDSPAARAGLKCGDKILMIDNDSVDKCTTDEVSKRLKGQASTHLSITVKRPYVADSILTFNLIREKIKLNPITYYGITPDSVGYIALNTYNEHSASGVKKALLEFKSHPKLKGVVLDLRSNGGGLVDEAIKILGFFLPKGTEVLTTKGRTTQQLKVYKTSEAPIMPDMPLVVLINDGSASASEITVGALQDLDRAVVVGQRSFGKGLVQTTRPIGFNNLLKLTIAKYYIPSGRLIQEIDYSEHNADGNSRKPDSLCQVFHTAGGREVRDGGGITPDIKIKEDSINRLVYKIVQDKWDSDFATKYAAEHPTIPSPADFEITDEIFEEFKQFLHPEKFEYDKVCEIGVSLLRKTAESEGYMTDSVKTEFDRLEQLLKHDLNRDLDRNRAQISTYLAGEILSRYYYDAGVTENLIKTCKCMAEAVRVLSTPGEYDKILHPQQKKKQKRK